MGRDFLTWITMLLILASGCINGDVGEETRVCFGERCFAVEVADEPRERSEGLMFRESLDEDRGMLFVFGEEGEYGFWMKNTLIPLDIIWIDSEGEVVFISKDAQPCNAQCPTIEPGKKALYVLELNGGVSGEIGLGIGDKIRIENL